MRTLEDLDHFDRSTGADEPNPSKSGRDFGWITAANNPKPILNGNWLIKGFRPRRGLGTTYGRPGGGKSVLETDISLHISEGLRWRGLKTTQAAVTYVASEAGRMGVNRVLAWCKHHRRPWPQAFRMSPLTLDLRSTTDDVRALARDIKANQSNCGLIDIDTLARNMAGGNENSSEDMGAFVNNMALLESLTGAFVNLVHHSGKDEAKGSRGHSSLLGALDFEGEVKRAQGKPGTMRVTKLRDGQDGAEFGFDILGVELGLDEDNEPVSAPVAVEIGLDEALSEIMREPQGKNQVIIATAFEQYVCDHGRDPPTGTGFPEPGKVKAVNYAEFQDFAAGKMRHGEAKYRTRAVKEAVDAMIDNRFFCQNGGMLWRL